MTSLVGAVLVFTAATWLGVQAGRQMTIRTVRLRELVEALQGMRRELSFSLTPLPLLLRRASDRTHGEVSAFFLRCAKQAQNSEGEFSKCWNEETERLQGCLPERAAEHLRPLGQELGRHDWQEDDGILRLAIEGLEDCLKKAEREAERLGDLYRTLGATAGAFLVLLFL